MVGCRCPAAAAVVADDGDAADGDDGDDGDADAAVADDDPWTHGESLKKRVFGMTRICISIFQITALRMNP